MNAHWAENIVMDVTASHLGKNQHPGIFQLYHGQ